MSENEARHKLIVALAQAEAAEGIYDAMPAAAAGSQPCEHPVETTTTFQTVTPFSDTARLNWIEQRFVCITGSGVSGSTANAMDSGRHGRTGFCWYWSHVARGY